MSTAKEIKKIDKMLDSMLPEGADRAQGQVTFKVIWPAVKAILTVAKNTLGIFKPKWKIAIDLFIAGMDIAMGGLSATGFN